MVLDHHSYIDHLRRESDRFLEVLRGCDPAGQVPSCPDWNADDLLWHLGEVQWFWGSVVADRLQDVEGLKHPDRPADRAGLLRFFEEQATRLADALAAAEPDEPVYMWAPDKSVGYVARRQAHEALIHRLDAELTADQVTALDTELAADGVDEALRMMYGGCPPWGTFTPSEEQVDVVASDTGLVVPVALGRFTGTDPGDGTAYDEDDLSASAADPQLSPRATVTGRAEDLDGWLWHRRDASALTVSGDAETFARLEAVLAQSID